MNATAQIPTSNDTLTAGVLDELRAIRAALEAGPAEALGAEASAEFCGVSRSKWHDLNARGLCPAPVEIGDGRCPRWCRTELRAWLQAGAPSRVRWNETRIVALRRAV